MYSGEERISISKWLPMIYVLVDITSEILALPSLEIRYVGYIVMTLNQSPTSLCHKDPFSKGPFFVTDFNN